MRSFCGAALLVVFGLPALAAAQPRDWLSWDAPADCGSEEDLLETVRRLLGDPAELPEHDWSFHLTVRTTSQGWHLTAEATSESEASTRELDSATCPALLDAGAIMIALWIDPEAVIGTESHPAAVTQESVAVQASPVAAVEGEGGSGLSRPPHVEPPPPAVPSTLDYAVLVGVTGILDVEGRPGAGGRAGLAVRDATLSGELDVVWLPPMDVSLRDHPASGATVELLGAHLSGCVAPFATGARLEGCVDVELGALSGRGFGVDHARQRLAPWLALGAGVRLTLPLSARWLVQLGASALVPAHRPTFTVDGAGAVYRPAWASARLEAGLGWRIP